MTTEAERLLKDSGWLPEVLRRADLVALDGPDGRAGGLYGRSGCNVYGAEHKPGEIVHIAQASFLLFKANRGGSRNLRMISYRKPGPGI